MGRINGSNSSHSYRDHTPFVEVIGRRLPIRRSSKSGDLGSPITKTPASRFNSRAMLDALSNLATRALDFLDSGSKGSEGAKNGGVESGEKKGGKYQRILTGILGLAASQWPETTKSVTDFINKVGSPFGFSIKNAAAETITNTVSPTLASSSTSASSSMAETGFRSLEEMLGNGLYTEAPPSAMMTPANSATSSTLSSAGSLASGAAGLYSMFEGGKLVADANKVGGSKGAKAGGIGGLTAGLGAGMALNAAGIALGPIGWAAILAGGLIAGGLAGWRLGDRDRWKTEGKRLEKLLKNGVEIPQELLGAMNLTRGRSKEELIHPGFPADFVGMTPDGWVNNKFTNSRDEKDLQPQDIWGNACFFEKFGNDWLGKFSEEQRFEIAKSALDTGAVREKFGTIDVRWTPELEEKIRVIGEAPVNETPEATDE